MHRIARRLAEGAWTLTVLGGPWLACGSGDARTAPSETAASSTPTPAASAEANLPTRPGVPADFPRDVPIPTGVKLERIEKLQSGAFVAVLSSDLEPDVAADLFAEQLTALGWRLDSREDVSARLFAQKDERLVTVIARRIGDAVSIELGVSN